MLGAYVVFVVGLVGLAVGVLGLLTAGKSQGDAVAAAKRPKPADPPKTKTPRSR